jgi:D-psicose/D-tagatose/L-ribulose 3-epimerase
MWKYAVSNIAWDTVEDAEMADLLARYQVTGIEIAPNKLLTDIETNSWQEAQRYRRWWQQRGFSLIAMQALLFARPNLFLFADEKSQRETFKYLAKLCELAGELEIPTLVFGSPKNRLRQHINCDEAEEIAVEFFGKLAEKAASHGAKICIEANPAVYGCDFINFTLDSLKITRKINHPGNGFHIDTGCMIVNGEHFSDLLPLQSQEISHIHISEAGLEPLGKNSRFHSSFKEGLRTVGYKGWLSLEMRAPQGQNGKTLIEESVAFMTQHYRL